MCVPLVAHGRRLGAISFVSCESGRYGPADLALAEDLASRPDYIEAYRRRYAFHPIHGILATHPLKRLRHIGRVIVAGPQDPHVPRHLGFEVASSVEEAVARARTIHGPECAIAYVEQPPLVEP